MNSRLYHVIFLACIVLLVLLVVAAALSPGVSRALSDPTCPSANVSGSTRTCTFTYVSASSQTWKPSSTMGTLNKVVVDVYGAGGSAGYGLDSCQSGSIPICGGGGGGGSSAFIIPAGTVVGGGGGGGGSGGTIGAAAGAGGGGGGYAHRTFTSTDITGVTQGSVYVGQGGRTGPFGVSGVTENQGGWGYQSGGNGWTDGAGGGGGGDSANGVSASSNAGAGGASIGGGGGGDGGSGGDGGLGASTAPGGSNQSGGTKGGGGGGGNVYAVAGGGGGFATGGDSGANYFGGGGGGGFAGSGSMSNPGGGGGGAFNIGGTGGTGFGGNGGAGSGGGPGGDGGDGISNSSPGSTGGASTGAYGAGGTAVSGQPGGNGAVIVTEYYTGTSVGPGTSVVSTPLTGWLWSDNTGWFSLNCSSDPTGCSGSAGAWGVSVDSSTGYLTGWAWSDNVGWIEFGGLSNFPSGSGTTADNAKLTGSVLSGWVRACAGTQSGDCSSMTSRSDGWDGWISLNGIATDNSPYQFKTNGTGGFVACNDPVTHGSCAWGSDVIGWVDATYAKYSCPAQPNYCETDGKTLCTYNTNSCSFSCNLCQGTGGICQTTSSGATCAVATPYCNITQPNGAPNVCITAVPALVGPGSASAVQVTWNVSNVTGTCNITGSNNDSWQSPADSTGTASGTGQSTAITTTTTYTLACTGVDNNKYSWTATATYVPIYEER